MGTRDTLGKISRCATRSVRLAWAWLVRFIKLRYHGCRLCKANRQFDERTSRLGMEFYSLYSQGEKEFLKSLVVLQQLKIVEEAESRVFAVKDTIDAIEEEYIRKKSAIAGHTTVEE